MKPVGSIQNVRARRAGLKDALVESGAVRFRPILLNAGPRTEERSEVVPSAIEPAQPAAELRT